MPCLATSRARLLDHPTKESRSAFEIARFGIGATIPEDVEVTILPHLASLSGKEVHGNDLGMASLEPHELRSRFRPRLRPVVPVVSRGDCARIFGDPSVVGIPCSVEECPNLTFGEVAMRRGSQIMGSIHFKGFPLADTHQPTAVGEWLIIASRSPGIGLLEVYSVTPFRTKLR
jgi:hypothetical protein